MADVAYRSHVTVTRHRGPLRTAVATIERVLGFHADRCPVARTIGGCVDITTAVELVAEH